MARYKYNGEPSRAGLVVGYGPTVLFRLHLKTGQLLVLAPIPPATHFVVGEDIGHDITDERAIRHLDVDERFTRL